MIFASRQVGTPVTPNDFRRLALSFPEAAERAHMNHPDFRVRGKIFATLHYPDKSWGMVKLSPIEQEMFVRAEPAIFIPVKGAWGRKGCTSVCLKPAKKSTVRRALAAAWSLAAPEDLSGASNANPNLAAVLPSAKARRSRRKKV
jgi:hypothetical protein